MFADVTHWLLGGRQMRRAAKESSKFSICLKMSEDVILMLVARRRNRKGRSIWPI